MSEQHFCTSTDTGFTLAAVHVTSPVSILSSAAKHKIHNLAHHHIMIHFWLSKHAHVHIVGWPSSNVLGWALSSSRSSKRRVPCSQMVTKWTANVIKLKKPVYSGAKTANLLVIKSLNLCKARSINDQNKPFCIEIWLLTPICTDVNQTIDDVRRNWKADRCWPFTLAAEPCYCTTVAKWQCCKNLL